MPWRLILLFWFEFRVVKHSRAGLNRLAAGLEGKELPW